MKERSTAECERIAERNGITGMYAGHFPHIPFGPPPTFKPTLPPQVLRQTALPRRARVADRVAFFNERGEVDG